MKLLQRLAAPAGGLILIASLSLHLASPEQGVLVRTLLGAGLVLTLLGVFLNLGAIASRLRGRAVREGSGDVAYIILVALILGLLNFVAARNPRRFDLTEQKSYTLAEQTRKILAGLPREVQARVYAYPNTRAEQTLQDLLEEYASLAPVRFRHRFVDPLKNPAMAREDSVTQENTVVLESGPQTTTLVLPDEEALTNGILKVTRDESRSFCFAMGHGEKDVQETGQQGFSAFAAALEKQHAKVETFSPALGVPEACAAVIVAGPRKSWLPTEREKLQAWLEGGGRAAILVDPEVDSGLQPLLERYGIGVENDLIIDRASALVGGQADIPLVPADGYESHPIVKKFGYQTFYPLATSLTVAESPPSGVRVQALARTTSLAWGEKSYAAEAPTGRLKMDSKDTPGPLIVAAAATRPVGDPSALPADDSVRKAPQETRLVVFGDSDFPTNAYYGGSGNGQLLLNTANWLAGEEDLVAIPPKSRLPRIVTLDQREATLIWTVSMLFAPATILIVGAAIWFRRRRL
jgi:ABC-type uncharacterized transport system involved in gliding motility auxiliary subunit